MPRRRGPNPSPQYRTATDVGFRTLPILEYEARYGRVNEYERVEGGTVEFVIERSGDARFVRVTKDGRTFHALRPSTKPEA